MKFTCCAILQKNRIIGVFICRIKPFVTCFTAFGAGFFRDVNRQDVRPVVCGGVDAQCAGTIGTYEIFSFCVSAMLSVS